MEVACMLFPIILASRTVSGEAERREKFRSNNKQFGVALCFSNIMIWIVGRREREREKRTERIRDETTHGTENSR